jgi:hypothetical protein
MTRLVDRRFRANPDYELLSRDRAAACVDPSLPIPPAGEPFYGYLQPKQPSQLRSQAISPDAALLFLSLQHEGPLPDYFRVALGARVDDRILRLVLDGVLQVEHEGAFVSGAVARDALLGDRSYYGDGPIAGLSILALRYAEALGDLTTDEMTLRLYGFGRLPLVSARKGAFDRAWIQPFGVLRRSRTLENYWVVVQSGNPHWIMCRPRRTHDDAEALTFKLYVSPRLDDIDNVFAASAELLGQCAGIRAMKLGRGAAGLARPDKLVAYFCRLDDLQEAGTSLYRRLQGCSVHGVPFTAELSRDGLLSWGADRPRTRPEEAESWRLWIARRLATHLATARASNASAPLWRFVLDRLRLDGVNPATWAPTAHFWSSRPIET